MSYKVHPRYIKKVVIQTDFCALNTTKHDAAGWKKFLTTKFMQVFQHNNIILVAAATKDGITGIDEKFHLEEDIVQFIDIASVYQNMRVCLSREVEKSTYGLKDCFDFVYGSNPSVPSIRMEKDKEMRLADWNLEFRKGIPWTAKMRRYSAIDPVFQLLAFDGIRMFVESWKKCGFNVTDHVQSIQVGGPAADFNKLPVVIDYENLSNAYVMADIPHPWQLTTSHECSGRRPNDRDKEKMRNQSNAHNQSNARNRTLTWTRSHLSKTVKPSQPK